MSHQLSLRVGQLLSASLLLFVFLIPFPHVTVLTEASFYLSVACAGYLAATRRLPLQWDRSLLVPMLLFTAWAALSSFWAGDFGANMEAVYNHIVKMVVLYLLLVSVFTGRREFRWLVWAVVLSVAVYAGWGIIQEYVLLGHPLFRHRLAPDAQLNANRLASICVVAFLLGLTLWGETATARQRALLCAALAVLVAAVFLTLSRSALVGAAAGLVVLAWHRPRQMALMLAVLLAAAALILATSSKWQTKAVRLVEGKDVRYGIYLTALVKIGEKPVAGYGFKHALKTDWSKYNDRLPERFRTGRAFAGPHNFILDVAMRLGLVGIVLYGILLAGFARRGMALIRRGETSFTGSWALAVVAAVLAIHAGGMFTNMFHIKTETLLYVMFALLTILSHVREGEDRRGGQAG
jgi:O-antigen ligase